MDFLLIDFLQWQKNQLRLLKSQDRMLNYFLQYLFLLNQLMLKDFDRQYYF